MGIFQLLCSSFQVLTSRDSQVQHPHYTETVITLNYPFATLPSKWEGFPCPLSKQWYCLERKWKSDDLREGQARCSVIFKPECFHHSNGRSVSYFKGHLLTFYFKQSQGKKPEIETLEEWLSAATLKGEHQTLVHNSGAWALASEDQSNPVRNFFSCLSWGSTMLSMQVSHAALTSH